MAVINIIILKSQMCSVKVILVKKMNTECKQHSGKLCQNSFSHWQTMKFCYTPLL